MAFNHNKQEPCIPLAPGSPFKPGIPGDKNKYSQGEMWICYTVLKWKRCVKVRRQLPGAPGMPIGPLCPATPGSPLCPFSPGVPGSPTLPERNTNIFN